MLCAYAALHIDNRPITEPNGRPFRSTSYTAAEATARAHNGHVKQIGASYHPPIGIVAEVLAEDEARTERTETALNTPPPSAPSAVANEAAEDRQTGTPATETPSTVKPPKQPKTSKAPKPAGEPARATRKSKSPTATSTTAVSE